MFVIDNEVLHQGFSEAKSNKCPTDVNGGYGDYSEFSNCTYLNTAYSCRVGVQHRNRSCINPTPEGGGKDCSELGSPTESKACTMSCTCPSTHKYAYASGKYCCNTPIGIADAATQSDKCACCFKDTSNGDCATDRSCSYNVEADFALNKPSWSLSTLYAYSCTQLDCRARSANDGKSSTYSRTTRAHSTAWWYVDMEMQVNVKKILLLLPAVIGRYNDLKVETRLAKTGAFKLCRYIGKRNGNVVITCKQDTTARFVKISVGMGNYYEFYLSTVNIQGTVE